MNCVRPPLSRPATFTLVAAALVMGAGAIGPVAAKSKKDPYELSRPMVGAPTLALISLDDQRVTLYDAKGKLLQAPVSSGEVGRETPVGIYSVLQKKEEHYSNLYNNASMPHMQRITWSGVAMHGGPLPGYPASHGCVRLPYKFAEKIFGLTNLGMRVIISRNDVAPVPISHPLLFRRTPYHGSGGIVTKAAALVGSMIGETAPENEPADVAKRRVALEEIIAKKTVEAEEIEKKAEPVRALVKERKPAMKRAESALKAAEKAEKRAADSVAYWEKILNGAKSDKSKERAEKRKQQEEAKLAEARAKLESVRSETQPNIDSYQDVADSLKALEDERDAARKEASVARRKLSPVAVFISRQTQKLYVRQGFEPVFEVPVTIRDPHSPIGTHTYTAVEYGDNGQDMIWNVVSIAGGQGRSYESDDFYYGDYDDYYRPRRRAKRAQSKEATPTDLAKATAALDRITIPEEAKERISELVLPGSSLIVSDEEAHKETGKQTGFIVLISGEPQGAIKQRPRGDPYGDEFYYGYDDYYNRRGRRQPRGGGGPFFGWW